MKRRLASGEYVLVAPELCINYVKTCINDSFLTKGKRAVCMRTFE